LFFNEALGGLAGRQTVVDHLAEYFLMVLRGAIDSRLVSEHR